MNFGTPEKVQATLRQGDYVAMIQGDNRTRVNNLFNGFPPLSPAEAKKANIRININFNEAARIAQHGNRQLRSAFLGPKNYFRIHLPNAPVEKQVAWEIFATRTLNKIMKRCKKYVHVQKYKWSSFLLHGYGPTLWYDDHKWCPDYISLANWRVPTDSTTDFENLNWFAVREPYTVYSLAKKVWGENADKNWSKKSVAKILASKDDINYDNATACNWLNNPEKMAELVKQNGMYYQSDAVPTLPLWHFYYLDDSDLVNKSWKMCVVPDVLGGTTAADPDTFLYKSNEPVASDLSHILHCQFGDLNVDPPFKIHAVRGLGFMLMEPCFYSNLTRCRFLQHVHEGFNVWFRVQDPQGRARAQKTELYDRAIIPEGVSIVPQDQRHQIQFPLVEGAMQEMRQLNAESGTAYTQDVHEPGDERETATKTLAKEQVASQLLGGLLDDAFGQEQFAYEEIGRRFCIPNSTDPDVREFQKACQQFGIPRQFLSIDQWEIEPERPLGNGNQSLAMAQAQQLMGVRPLLSPEAQQEALHEFIEVATDDPRKADRLAPLNEELEATPAQKVAEADFSVLMRGLPVNVLPRAIVEQIPVQIGLLSGEIANAEQYGNNMVTLKDVLGMQAVVQHTGKLIEMLGQDQTQRQAVQQFKTAIGKLANSIKGFSQRIAEQQQAQNDPEAQAKAQSMMMQAQTKQQIATSNAAHKQQLNTAKLQQTMQHKQLQAGLDQQRKNQEVAAQIARDDAEVAAAIERDRKETEAYIETEKKKASAKESQTPEPANV